MRKTGKRQGRRASQAAAIFAAERVRAGSTVGHSDLLGSCLRGRSAGRGAQSDLRRAIRALGRSDSNAFGACCEFADAGRAASEDSPTASPRCEGEVSLPSWRQWSSRDPLEKRAVEQMVLGVSRRYRRSLEPLPAEFQVHGVSKSAVSESFVVGTANKLAR